MSDDFDGGPSSRALDRIAAASAATTGAAIVLLFVRMVGEDAETRGADAIFVYWYAVLGLLLVSAAWTVFRCLIGTAPRPLVVRTLWTSPLVCLMLHLVGRTVPSAFALAAFACLVAGLSFAQSIRAHERLAAAFRGREVPAPGAASKWRLRTSLVLWAATLGLALLLEPLVAWKPLAPSRSWSTGESGGESGRARGGGDGDSRFVIDPAAVGADAAWLGRSVLLEVRPFRGGAPAGDQGPLYLRGMALTQIDADGQWLDEGRPPRRVRDAEDGAPDGWCRFGAQPAPDAALELEIRQYAIEHAPTRMTLLHTLPRTAGVSLREVRYAEERLLLAPSPPTSWMTYRTLAPHPARARVPTDRSITDARDPRSLTLPRESPLVEQLATEAARVAAGETSALGRVRAVVRHLKETYEYDRRGEDRAADEALRRFCSERRGTCSQFAVAAAWMLRSLGIPTRVATGFLLQDWVEERGVYVARGLDYHAWIEVQFADTGWTAFDPTPALTRPQQDERDLEQRGGFSQAIARLVVGLREFRRNAGASVREHPFLWILALSVSVTTLAWVLRRAGERRALREEETAPDAPTSPAWTRLLTDLARLGYRRRGSQTAREFARETVERGGASFVPFEALTARQQEARFGGRPLTAEDDAAIDAFRRAIRRTPAPAATP